MNSDDDSYFQEFKRTLFGYQMSQRLDEEDLYKLFIGLNNICNHCWDAYRPCTCMRDD